MARPIYVPTVAETTVPCSREQVFAAVEAELGVTASGDTTDRRLGSTVVTETVISHEPPWRLVLDATGPDGSFHQESFVAVPHADGCLVMWSALVAEPVDDDAE